MKYMYLVRVQAVCEEQSFYPAVFAASSMSPLLCRSQSSQTLYIRVGGEYAGGGILAGGLTSSPATDL
jgi:hypothetical protein